MNDNQHIAILMCTYNGAQYLREQLDSFVLQTHKNWALYISDDGSSDETHDIIRRFADANPNHKVEWIEGPKRGFCANFLSLICKDIQADYYALSDQDDIWLPNKLTRALEMMKETGASLYGGRTTIVNHTGKVKGLSPLFKRPPSFNNALVQSLMGGNTMVLDQQAVMLVKRFGVVDVQSHDWWIYILCTGADYKVFYDAKSNIHYRQTGNNLVGSNQGLRAKICRAKRLMKSEFRGWNQRHVRALEKLDVLSDKNKDLFIDFSKLHCSKGFKPLKQLLNMRLYRQTYSGNLALWVAVFLGKL